MFLSLLYLPPVDITVPNGCFICANILGKFITDFYVTFGNYLIKNDQVIIVYKKF